MRLQLRVGVVGVVGLLLAARAGTAAADPPSDSASATVRVYADDDRLTVWSPAAHAQVTTGKITTDVDVALDAVSAASVDVVTAASPTKVRERRIEAGVGLTLAATPTLDLRLGALVSHEHDYDAIRVGLGLITQQAERNTTLELRARLGRDHATAVGQPDFAGDRTSAALVAVLTQLVDRRTVVDLTVDGSWADGWHGSPYRTVLLADPLLPMTTRWSEVTPARRLALAIALRGRRAIGERWFTTAIARGYVDDWDVHSATASLEVRRRLTARTLLGVDGRGYLQDGASFWRARLADGTTPPTYRTADRTLGPMATAEVDLIGERVVDGDDRRVTVALGGLGLWFFDNTAQARRRAVTATVSFTTPL